MIHFDTKKLGKINRVGHRITGDRQGRIRGAGWELLHVAIDDFSRLAYVEVLPDERQETCSAFLRRAQRVFQDHGIKVRKVLTDNGSAYVSKHFAQACSALQIGHSRTRPYRPRDKRQSRALHSDLASRMGLPLRL